jgi:hypothetical protein
MRRRRRKRRGNITEVGHGQQKRYIKPDLDSAIG